MKVFIVVFIVAVIGLTSSYPTAQQGRDDMTLTGNPDVSTSTDEDSSSEISDRERPNLWGFHYNLPGLFRLMLDSVLEELTRSSFGPSPDWGEVANATSVQKVIEGHVYTINDTTYTRDGLNSDNVVFVRTIDVRPVEGFEKPEYTESAETETPADTDENSNENQEVAETIDNRHSEQAELLERREFHPSETFNDIYNDVDNSIDVFNTKPISLERDIYINKLKDETKGEMFMIPHDVEVFDVEDGKPVYSYYPFPPNTFSQRTQTIVT